jgi:transposase-like protein
MTDMTKPEFTSEPEARKHLEALRWSQTGRFCPHCGVVEKSSPVNSEAHGEGFYYCLSCRKTFTVTVGTIFERSHVPLHKWMLAFHLMSASKKGISAHQLHRMLGVTYKTAWFMAHRIRECMRDGFPGPLGGEEKTVEIDEMYVGPTTYKKKRGKIVADRGTAGKTIVLALVERGGKSRSIIVEKISREELATIILKNAHRASTINTDEARWYKFVGGEFIAHHRVNHRKGEYARGIAHTNTVEGFFSIFRRGMKGVYQHCSEKHLQRYLDEFDFRYSHREKCGYSDAERADAAIKGAEGKRLMYRNPNARAA